MPSTMASLVTDPDSFFRDRRDDASFLGPALVITAIAVALPVVIGLGASLWGLVSALGVL